MALRSAPNPIWCAAAQRCIRTSSETRVYAFGDRLQVRAQVTVGDPDEFPGCLGKTALASVEVVDRLTRATHIILTNPVSVEIPTRQ